MYQSKVVKKLTLALIFCGKIFSANANEQESPIHWKMSPKSSAECLARQGCWGKVGIPGNPYPPQCTIQTSDSGKVCKDSKDCEGYCISPQKISPSDVKVHGQCSDRYPLLGCVNYFVEGRVVRICTD